MITIFIALVTAFGLICTSAQTQKKVYAKKTSGICDDPQHPDTYSVLTTQTECETAASVLNLNSDIAQTTSSAPYGCSNDNVNGLYFNANSAVYTCGSLSQRYCVCALTCGPGTFQDEDSKTSCKNCPTGRTGGIGASACGIDASSCPVGQFPSGTNTVCEDCPTGKYNDNTGQLECKICPTGTHNNKMGQSLCENCPTGEEPTIDFIDCVPPAMQPKVFTKIGADDTLTCTDVGAEITTIELCNEAAQALSLSDTTAATPASPNPNQPPGCWLLTMMGILGFTPNGYAKCTTLAQCVCELYCEPGKYQNRAGQTKCISCETGQYQDKARRSNCKSCDKGQYADPGDQTSCKLCEPGKFNPNVKQLSCTLCLDGTYTIETGRQTPCKGCSPGRYLLDNTDSPTGKQKHLSIFLLTHGFNACIVILTF